MADDHYYGIGNGMVFTKPFEVGKTYRRVDGKEVTCIKVTTTKGYECAQFDDFEDTFARAIEGYEDDPTSKYGKPEDSGHRYNRASDRGRCTGSKWNEFAVIPELDDADYIHEGIKHLFRSASHIIGPQLYGSK